MRRVLTVIGVIAIAVVIGTAIALLSGWYNVGASTHHSTAVDGVLRLAMERSVRLHARSVTLPKGTNLHDRALAGRAADDYREMCLLCHGAPGKKAAFWTAGFDPAAPPLTDRKELGWSDGELYWIIKHGVKDTAMPAFGATHDEDELCALAALTRQLPTMTPPEFEALGHESK